MSDELDGKKSMRHLLHGTIHQNNIESLSHGVFVFLHYVLSLFLSFDYMILILIHENRSIEMMIR